MKKKINQYFDSLKIFLDSIVVSDTKGEQYSLEAAVDLTTNNIIELGSSIKKMMFVGNGASASISSHMATDFWKTNGIRALAFNDSSGLTCISNDYGYKHVFEKPIEMFSDEGDMLVAISSSGQSENIIRAVETAKRNNLKIITLSGFKENNPLRQLGDINYYVPASEYGYVEVLHHAICHSWIDIVSKKNINKEAQSNAQKITAG